MSEFPGNSHKAREAAAPKDIPKLDITVEKVKPSIGKRFKSIFFGGDFKTAARGISADVILPALRDLLYNSVSKGVERVVYGQSQVQRSRPSNYRPITSYNTTLRRDPRETSAMLPNQPPHSASTRHDGGELLVSSREEAELVVDTIRDIIDRYGVASVADLNEAVGLPSTHIDQKWGWVEGMGFEVRQHQSGYIISLPSPVTI